MTPSAEPALSSGGTTRCAFPRQFGFSSERSSLDCHPREPPERGEGGGSWGSRGLGRPQSTKLASMLSKSLSQHGVGVGQ